MQVKADSVSVLILGAGWTGTFLIPLLVSEDISYAATTTDGRDGTIKFKFDPDSADDEEQYKALPTASTVVVVFPLKGSGQSELIHSRYSKTHPDADARWVQLGSSGIYRVDDQELWVTRHSKYDTGNARAVAEDELRSLGGAVLNLSGLWGGTRDPKGFLLRAASSKEKLKEKSSLHMVHGQDVAQAIVALHRKFTPGQRWLLTDLIVYDWWELILGWGSVEDAQGPHTDWVRELMAEEDIRALPRSSEQLGRCYDSREFWEYMGISPARSRM